MRASQLDTALIAELLGEIPTKDESPTPIVRDSLQSRIDQAKARLSAIDDMIADAEVDEVEPVQRFQRMPIPSENTASTSDIDECECEKGFDIARFLSMGVQSFLHIGLLSLLFVYGTIGICICNLLLQIAMCL